MALEQGEIDEINAWANVLQAVGQSGHKREHANGVVLSEITKLVKERLEAIKN
jgi:hypothetical protein